MFGQQLFTSIFACTLLSSIEARRLYARDCSFQWPANEGDTCASIANNWSLSEADFISYNPGVNCGALEVGKEYCVEWEGTPPNQSPVPTSKPVATPTPRPIVSTSPTTFATITTPIFTTTNDIPIPSSATCQSTPVGVTTPSPVQSGLVCGCTKFYKIVSGDGCWAIANANGITLDDFYAWNPATANECKNLIPGNYVCIGKGVATPIPKPTSTGPFVPIICTWDRNSGQYICPTAPPATQQPASTSTNQSPPPGPTQPGIPSNCNKWVMQKDGVYCYDMAKAAGITRERLYSLNPALKGDCSGLWLGYAYCIGTS